jgi:hypothetical protein
MKEAVEPLCGFLFIMIFMGQHPIPYLFIRRHGMGELNINGEKDCGSNHVTLHGIEVWSFASSSTRRDFPVPDRFKMLA